MRGGEQLEGLGQDDETRLMVVRDTEPSCIYMSEEMRAGRVFPAHPGSALVPVLVT